MDETRIILAGFWIAVMLTYLLGDVLRIFAGDATPGEIMGTKPSQGMWMLIAVIMLVPIVMIILTLTLPYPAVRWINIVVPVIVAGFNLLGLPYPGMYDNFLIVVSIVFNAVTIWFAWKWVI
jgi:hypothetical protein